MKYYLKFLGNDRQPCHWGSGQWPEPGVWQETIENPIPCATGYHLCRLQDFFIWCNAPTLWVAEAEGVIPAGDKVVAKRARLIRQVEEWNECNQRLFAADCAERVLKQFESVYPGDKRPRAAIETARRFSLGKATVEELETTRFAARSALQSITGFVADYTAKSTAWSAASYAAGFIVGSAERDWQINHLLTHYLKLNSEEFE